jgi:glycosyltransferase involved in cell wall biosynthesis
MKMLLGFDNVYAVSNYSLNIVKGYLYWLDAQEMPHCQRIHLGADFNKSSRAIPSLKGRSREVIMTGIVEPRKNQTLLLDAVEILAKKDLDFLVRFIGRVNPIFGKPIIKRMKEMKKAGYPVNYEYAISDEQMMKLYDHALISVFPSKTEGCGLPVLESIWEGLPVIASDIPSVLENGSGGVRYFKNNNAQSLADALEEVLSDETSLQKMYQDASEQKLLSWAESGKLFLQKIQKNLRKD